MSFRARLTVASAVAVAIAIAAACFAAYFVVRGELRGQVDRELHRLRVTLLLIGAGGIGLAAALGAGVTRAALRPVRQLSDMAAEVARTRDLTQRVAAGGRDELATLATSFNTMLEALEES